MNEHPIEKALTDGQSYEIKVPDTLDLPARLSLAINALTRAFQPTEGWGLNFFVDLSRRPPVMYPSHLTDAWLNIPPKFIEALLLCRLATGSVFNMDVDRSILAQQMSLIGEDGLSYAPRVFFPGLEGARGFSESWAEGRTLTAMALLGQLDPAGPWFDIAKRKVDRLFSLSVKKENFRFFWKGRFFPGEIPPCDVDEPWKKNPSGSLGDREGGLMGILYSMATVCAGAANIYRVAGYSPALELSLDLSRWALRRVFYRTDGWHNFHHFHTASQAIMAMVLCGLAAEDEKLLERADACFRWMRELGDLLVGFFPEEIPGSRRYLERKGNTAEICKIADMVSIALYLSRAGIEDYWDDIERWVRNLYAEGQIVDCSFVDNIPKELARRDAASMPHEETNELKERIRGSFLGWMRANDGLFIDPDEKGRRQLFLLSIMHCCTANGARSFYHVLDSILTTDGNTATINLPLNAASECLDLNSYLPAAGRLEIINKAAKKIKIRKPGWLEAETVDAYLNGRRFRLALKRSFFEIEGLEAGDRCTVSFPLKAVSLNRIIGEMPYRLTLKGPQVTNIEPAGEVFPLFSGSCRGIKRKTERFLAYSKIIW